MPSRRLPALFLWAASRPNGRTSVRSAWTRTISRTPHRATRNSITRDPIMTGSGRGLDASQSVEETGGCAVLERVSGRELFRIGRIGNLWYKFPRECARRAGKGRVRQFAHANRTLEGLPGWLTRTPAPSEGRRFRFRLNKPEAQAFRAFCDNHNLSVTEAMRRMARGAAGLGPTFSGEGHSQIVELTRQVRAVGVNLNQAVHHMNAGHAFPADEMRSWLEETLGVIKALDTLYSSLAGRARSRADVAVEQRSP